MFVVKIVIFIGFMGTLLAGMLDDYSQACIKGDANSCYQLAIAYRDGSGVMKDTEAYRQYLEIACEMNNDRACSELNHKATTRPVQSQVKREAQEASLGYLKKYTNARFGFTLSYPAGQFVKKVLSNNGDGITLYNNDKSLELKAYGSWYGDSIRQIYRDEQGWAKDAGQKVTYKVLKNRWFVLSGIDRKKRTIFYLKTYFSRGKSASFRLEYPLRDKARYNSLVLTISRNFIVR